VDIFELAGEWVKAHQIISIGIGASLGILISLIKPERVKIVGKAFSDLLKRVPLIGPMLEKKIEVIVDNFEEGMKQDEANTFSPNIPTVDTAKQKTIEQDKTQQE
jgi:hypothetical protein